MELAPNIYDKFLKTLKNFKRRQENQLKYDKRDKDQFIKKYESTGQTLIELIHEIKMNDNDKIINPDIEKLKDYNFNMNLYTNKELVDISFDIFKNVDEHKYLNIDDGMLKSLIEEICMNYNVVPFHNWTHGVQLAQMFFATFSRSDFGKLISRFELFIGLLAGLAHDMNHKGVNNAYKNSRKSESSIRYAEQAVLENMHISTFFNIVSRNPKYDIFQKMLGDQSDKEQKEVKDAKIAQVKKFKRLFTSAIISTDMERHFSFVAALKQKNESKVDIYKEQDSEFWTNTMVHVCDIGNPCYDYDNYMKWSYLLSQEFHDQTIKEQQRGLTPTAIFAYVNKEVFIKGQIGFIGFFLVPLWKELSILIPQLKTLDNQLSENVKTLKEKQEQIIKAKQNN